MKKSNLVLFNLVIPITEFFLSIVCFYYLFQMENVKYSIFSLFCILIIFKSFFGCISGICKIWLHIIERQADYEKKNY